MRPINIWYTGSNNVRKYLPLIEAGSEPQKGIQNVKYFLPEQACFFVWEEQGIDCRGEYKGEKCTGCRPEDTCGKAIGTDCNKVDFSEAKIQLASEWNEKEGDFGATVKLHSIKLIPPGCLCENDSQCTSEPRTTCEINTELPLMSCAGKVPCRGLCSTAFSPIVSVFSNKCLDVDYSDPMNSPNVIVRSCEDSASQKWSLDQIENGTFSIRSEQSEMCLDVSGSNTDDLVNVQLWECHSNYNQRWTLGN